MEVIKDNRRLGYCGGGSWSSGNLGPMALKVPEPWWSAFYARHPLLLLRSPVAPSISKFVSSPEPSHYSGFLHCQKTWNKLHFEPLPLVWETPTALGSSSHSATVELGGLRPPPEPWAFPQLGPRAASSFLLQACGDLSFPLTGAFWVAAGALDPPTRAGGAIII